MARPKREEQEKSAKERIEDAFFTMLSIMSFEDITIRALAAEAGVNHNLIYYYYENLQDLAREALDHTASEELILQVLEAIRDQTFRPEVFLLDAALMERVRRVRLYVRGDSAFLTGLFQNLLAEYWLRQMGRTEDSLSKEDRVDLRFILAGLCSLLSDQTLFSDPSTILSIWDRDLGRGIYQTLARISTSPQ